MAKKDLNKMTVEELRKTLNTLEQQKEKVSNKGKQFCIVRTYSAGVFAGMFDRKTKGKEGTIFDAIRLWYWKGACSLSQLANEGTKEPKECKFAQSVPEIDLREIIEIIPCSNSAMNNIKSVPSWEK